MSLLKVRGLRKSFGGVKAVRGVDFDLAESSKLAVIGPNGAGKSTLFDMIGGQYRPDAGRIFLDGSDITHLSPQERFRRGVGHTFQVAQIFSSMLVLETVQTALLSRERQSLRLLRSAGRYHREEALHLLSRVGMADLAESSCATLAYGDVKRVELAVALAGKPRLLLMDEPTAGMAMRERHDLMKLVDRLAEEDKLGILFTEHDMDVVFDHADHVLVLVRGALIAAGDPQTVRSDPLVREAYLGDPQILRGPK